MTHHTNTIITQIDNLLTNKFHDTITINKNFIYKKDYFYQIMTREDIQLMNKIPLDNIRKTLRKTVKPRYICPECDNTDIMKDKGEVICANCGLVLAGPYPYVGGVRIDFPCGYNALVSDKQENMDNI